MGSMQARELDVPLTPHDKLVMSLANGGVEAAGEYVGEALALVKSAGFNIGLCRDGESVGVCLIDPNKPLTVAAVLVWAVEDVARTITE